MRRVQLTGVGLMNLVLLLLLAAIWGASYLFIKVAVLEMSPLALSATRLALGALGLLAIIVVVKPSHPASSDQAGDKPPSYGIAKGPLWLRSLVLGLFGAVIPYLLIAWGEEHIPSGEAAVLNATSPLFSTVFGHWLRFWGAEERLTWARGLGLLLGIAGVAVVALGGARESAGGALSLAGHLAVVIASASYGIGALYARLAFTGTNALVPATAQTVAAAGVTVPLAVLFSLPPAFPSLQATGSLLALGILGTAVAYVIYYRLLGRVGATGVLSVTYLSPVFALVYGAALLQEVLTVSALAGLVLILVGVGLITRQRGSYATLPNSRGSVTSATQPPSSIGDAR